MADLLQVIGDAERSNGEPASMARVASELRALGERHPARANELAAAALEVEAARDALAMSVALAKGKRLAMAIGAAEEARARAADAPKASRARPKAHLDERRRIARERRQSEHLETARRGGASGPDAPVETLPGVGAKAGLKLRARGLETVADLALFLPRRWDDDRRLAPIASLTVGERQTTVGVVAHARAHGRRVEVVLEPLPDDPPGTHGMITLVWFHAPWGLGSRFERGTRIRASGVVDEYRGKLQMAHPETERVGDEGGAAAGIVPRYPDVPGVFPRSVARAVRAAVDRVAGALPDALPHAVREAEGLVSLEDALLSLHAPPKDIDADAIAALEARQSPAHVRFAFEEFFLLELLLSRRRAEEVRARAEPLSPPEAPLERALRSLPFELTGAQRRVVAEIGEDLRRDAPMRRLLQGDVGSGKTAVAMLAAAHAVAAGGQVALMAPTELLAEQHFRSLAGIARALALRVELVLGGARAAHRKKVRAGLEAGTIDVAVGTHALLTEGTRFRRLRLAIVDEQHRFGVGQRLRLVQKGEGEAAVSPHLLVMTATPIPRSLALVLYGDLSASVLDEMPPGRVPPTTRAYESARREEALRQVDRALEAGGRAYVICPLVEESVEMDLRAATTTFEEMAKRYGRERVALVHGRLGAEERTRQMERFATGDARVLVSTTVVEVGVDVREANCILVEHAERFGLAQLHQLRGRVGRAGQKSACLLVNDATTEEAQARLDVLCETHDGFRIAEEDLAIRGPGELFGKRQSGLPGFRFGDLRRDLPLLLRARERAAEVLARDPSLEGSEHEGTRRVLERLMSDPHVVIREDAG